jgi:hypothetical protein
MTTYVRTEEGQLAAYSPGSVLPRKLRSLLKVIDGKTQASVYSDSLRAFGDVQGVLTSLEMAGLIRPVSQTMNLEAALAAAANASVPSNMVWGDTGTQRTHPSDSQTHSRPMARGPSTQASYTSTDNAAIANSPVDNAARSLALASAVDTMSIFVLTHAPEHSFLVLKELESLTNLEQLAVTLGGYEQLISHLGPVGQEHLLLIKQILRDNM